MEETELQKKFNALCDSYELEIYNLNEALERVMKIANSLNATQRHLYGRDSSLALEIIQAIKGE